MYLYCSFSTSSPQTKATEITIQSWTKEKFWKAGYQSAHILQQKTNFSADYLIYYCSHLLCVCSKKAEDYRTLLSSWFPLHLLSFFCLSSEPQKIKQEKKGKQTQVHTPPGKRPKAWPVWPAAGQKQPVRRWGSWWWSAGHVLETPPRTPAHYQTPRRRSGGLTAPHRSCMAESRVKQSWCSWWKSAKRKRMWGRIWGSTRGHWWHRQRNYVQGKREGRRERRCRLTCWVKSSCSSEHGQAEN